MFVPVPVPLLRQTTRVEQQIFRLQVFPKNVAYLFRGPENTSDRTRIWKTTPKLCRPLFLLHSTNIKAHSYETSPTIFNPEGRIRQVDYAMAAVALAGTCVGILTKEGVVVAAERRKMEKLLDHSIMLEKIYKLTDNQACAVAGVIADANVLLTEVRLIAQRHFKRYGEEIPCEQLVSMLCDVKQAYTQFGGKRPFGVSILYMGWDKHLGYQLYCSEPCGNYSGWKAVAIGKNCEAVMSLLKLEYNEGDMTLKSAQALAIKCLEKTVDTRNLPPEKVEMAVLTRKLNASDIHIFSTAEIATLLQELAEPECNEPKLP